MTTLPSHVRTLIVGAGFGGIAMAAKLLREDPAAEMLVIEQAAKVGGTWRDNTYPGCACDVPSNLYSYSFALNPDWGHSYSPQPEILAYLQRTAERTGVLAHTVTSCALLSADWDAEAQLWRVRTNLGELTATVLIAATGTLSQPKLPDLPGLTSFAGTTFHSARWNHEHDLGGERVAVVGTGASAIQFVPEIVDQVRHLTVFQRTAAWVMPRPGGSTSARTRALYRQIPRVQKAVRGGVYALLEVLALVYAHIPQLLPLLSVIPRWHLRRRVPDAAKRAALTPHYTLGCKRLLFSSAWAPTIARAEVTLVSSGIDHVTGRGIVDANGVEHEVDTIIFGTGFTPTEPPIAHLLRGTDQHTLAEHWAGSPAAHRGTTVTGFPNLFLMYGPNTNLGHSSIVYMLESQATYITDALDTMRRRGLTSFTVRADAQNRYNDDIAEQLRTTVWHTGGCSSWYIDATGRNSVMWPTFTWRFRELTRHFDPEHYELVSNTRRGARGPTEGQRRRTMSPELDVTVRTL